MRLNTEVVRKAITLYRQGVALPEIASACNLTEKKTLELLTSLKLTTQRRRVNTKLEKVNADRILNPAKDAVVDAGQDYRRLIDAAANLQKVIAEIDPVQREVTVRIDTDSPIVLVTMSDWHLGSQHTDMSRILEVVDYIKNTPNAYCIFGGDVFDSAGPSSKHLSINNEALLQPSVVRKIAQGIFRELGSKLIGFVAGCHDTWLQDATDLDQVAEFSDSPYLGHGGAINLWVGSNVYRIGIRHKFVGGTNQSIFAANKNYLLRSDATADIVIIGHHHVSGVASEVWQGKERLYVRTGSAKAIDRYAAQLGLAPTRDSELGNAFPALVLGAAKRSMYGFADWQVAADIMEG